jgi:hypothetical protein
VCSCCRDVTLRIGGPRMGKSGSLACHVLDAPGAPVVTNSRELKHRAPGETRPVPASPQLVAALREHLADFGTGAEGRLFVTRTGRLGRPVAEPIRATDQLGLGGPGLGHGPKVRVDRGARGVLARRSAVRPSPRLCLVMVGSGGGAGAGGAVGRALGGGPAARVRPLCGRPGGDRPASDRRCAGSPTADWPAK